MSGGGGGHRRRGGKGHGGGHHGGAWKVAYADFVTAMMAFFLLLWLLNAVSQEQLEGISDYFSAINKHTTTSGGGGLLAGNVVATKGVFDSREETDNPRGRSAVEADHDEQETDPPEETPPPVRQQQTASEQQQFAEVEGAIRNALAANPELKALAKSLIVEETPEGLRIQIVDQDGLPMFPSGEAVMYQYTRKILELVVNSIRTMPQHIEVAGHTDAKPFANPSGYGNWELSTDRANAARRALVEMGLAPSRIEKVVGRAATAPLLPDTPEAPGNRRLSITLLRGTGVS
ncbi:MAG: flagellar motor protein MotB [Rhodospirillales bacterium]